MFVPTSKCWRQGRLKRLLLYWLKRNQGAQDLRLVFFFLKLSFSRLLDLDVSARPESLDKHRFLIQSKVVSEEDYDRIRGLSAPKKAEEVYLFSLLDLKMIDFSSCPDYGMVQRMT